MSKKGPMGWITATFPTPKPGGLGWKLENWVTALHVRIFQRTGGRILGKFDGAPLLILHSTGAKSGKARKSPVIFLADGDRVVVVGSIGGNPKHPGWYHNVLAGPEIEVEYGGRRRPMRAHQASAEETQALWPRLLEMWPAWSDYMERTDREFPVIICEPR